MLYVKDAFKHQGKLCIAVINVGLFINPSVTPFSNQNALCKTVLGHNF